MARSKKKVKAKKVAKKTKAKRKIVPKKNFAARAKMAGVLCIKLDQATGRPTEACVVKRLTSDVLNAASAGSIIAVVLKSNQVHHISEQINAKEQRFDHFMCVAKAPEPVVAEAPATGDVEGEHPISHANGIDRSPEAAQPSA